MQVFGQTWLLLPFVIALILGAVNTFNIEEQNMLKRHFNSIRNLEDNAQWTGHQNRLSIDYNYYIGRHGIRKQSNAGIYADNIYDDVGNVYPNAILTRDPTVIVNVPNSDVPSYRSVGSSYGVPINTYSVGNPYSSVPAASPTVVVTVPENGYDNTAIRGTGYPYGVTNGRRRI